MKVTEEGEGESEVTGEMRGSDSSNPERVTEYVAYLTAATRMTVAKKELSCTPLPSIGRASEACVLRGNSIWGATAARNAIPAAGTAAAARAAAPAIDVTARALLVTDGRPRRRRGRRRRWQRQR